MSLIKDNKKEYAAWNGMKTRCYNKNRHSFHYYGGRGIVVSDEFKNSFETFLNYIGKAPSPNHSIDRINNDGNYERGNIRWATKKEQMNNKRHTKKGDADIAPGVLNLTITNSKAIELICLISEKERISKTKVIVSRFLDQAKREGYKIDFKDIL